MIYAVHDNRRRLLLLESVTMTKKHILHWTQNLKLI